jgi:hypothetical protein
MTTQSTDIVAEDRQSLWILTFAPAIWAGHFFLSYLAGATWCGMLAGPEGRLEPVRVAIIAFAVLALLGIGITARAGWRRYRHEDREAEHHGDTAEDRHRFLGFATVLLSALSAVATIYVAVSTFFLDGCY